MASAKSINSEISTDVDLSDVTAACRQCLLLTEVRKGRIRLEVGTDIWKWISTTLGGALIAGVAFWITAQNGAVSRADMESFIQKNSPYAIDRQVVVNSLADLKDGQREMRDQISNIKERQDRIIAVLESQGKLIR